MCDIEFNHTPVMLNECIHALNIKPDGIYMDGTVGGAGHSSVIASKLTTGKLIALDKDDQALEVSTKRLACYPVILAKSDFKQFEQVLSRLGIEGLDGILLDLGVSSYQLDTAERGFSYRFDAPLDMRMDRTRSLTAYDVVNTYSEQQLIKILYEYGEESWAKNIVRGIVKQRKIAPIETTGELASIVQASIPRKFWGKGNPSKQTFQAIRIEVNGELDGLYDAVVAMARRLNKHGRMAVLTFHSLEDRIVKNAFKMLSSDCICDPRAPFCTCNHHKEGVLVNKKPIVASTEECKVNSRSTSAKLRIFEKL